MQDSTTFQQALDALYAGRSQAHLSNDPLSFCHRFSRPEDQEVAALIAAVFAYGNVKVILGSLERIFSIIGSTPADFVDQFESARYRQQLTGFKHRFNTADDLAALLWAIKQMREQYGSIEQFFCRFHQVDALTVEAGLNGFCAAILGFDYRSITGSEYLSPESSYRFLFPAPAGGSACKRLCMFLRWVTRPADGIDLGLWRGVRPAQLIIPVDRHIERISRLVGLTGRRTPDWKMACEITAALRRYDSDDPIKYDFSICHLGISEGCTGRRTERCAECGLNHSCTA